MVENITTKVANGNREQNNPAINPRIAGRIEVFGHALENQGGDCLSDVGKESISTHNQARV